MPNLLHTSRRSAQNAGLISGRHAPFWAALIISLAYYLGAKLGFALTLAPVPVSTLWPPNAILMAGLLLSPKRWWPLILLAVLGAHVSVQFQSGVPTTMVLCWYVSNCTEALLGATLLRRCWGGAQIFDTFRGTVFFLLCVGFAAPFISSFIDAAFVVANAWGDGGYWTIWRTRFFSNMLAAITLVPVILTTAEGRPHVRQIPRRSYVEVAAGLVALTIVDWVVFDRQRPGTGASPALLYAPLPLLVAAAVRFGPWGASTAMLISTLVAIGGAGRGHGPFVTHSPAENALAMQLFLIVAWIPVMSLAAVIRERASSDAKARASEEQLALAIEAAQLGRWEWDIAARRLTWSETTRRMYEVPLDSPIAPETYEALVHPDDRPLVAAASADGLAGRGIDVEFRILFPDGRIKWIHSKGRTVFDDAGRPVRMVGVKVDVTARKSAERQIQEQQNKLAQSSRVSMAGELSIALAHELNQPLAAILANASAARRFLLRDPPDLRELGEIVESIAADNRRAAAVITRFRELLKKGSACWTLLDVNAVVSGVIGIARADVISRGVSLTTRVEEGLPQVLGDSVQLQQVLLDLIVNACDAMEALPPRARRLLVSTGIDEQGQVRVTVRDSGPGVPADRADEIFEPFVTSKPQRLGLGLAICRSIISAHDGELTVQSEPACGAVFTFTLPAVRGADADKKNADLFQRERY